MGTLPLSDRPVFNRVILALRPEAQAFIASRVQTRAIEAGMVLKEENEPLTHAIFPQLGILSMMAEMKDGRTVEKASIGNEGFVGFTYLMGGSSAVSRTVVQVSGYASWLSIEDLEEAMSRFICFREAMLRYAKALIVQLMETVACNSLHTAEQRVSGWLLMANDRMQGGSFNLTQEALGRALALRRATISEISSDLLRDGAISYSRGQVTVLDRDRLHAHACECYDRIASAQLPPG